MTCLGGTVTRFANPGRAYHYELVHGEHPVAVGVDDVEDLIMGCAFPEAEQGFNIAKLVVQNADLPVTIGGATVNRFCGSSMTAIHIYFLFI